jgi:hypothetical protein
MAISGRRRFGLVVVVAALAVAAVGVVAVRADPAPNLPPIAADQLLASTLAALARPFTISGEVHTRFDLGIPQIPSSVGGDAGGGALSALALATGDQRYKVWRSADGVRIAHLLDLSEQDFVVSTSDAWFWDDPVRCETKQVLRAAARAVRLVDDCAGTKLEAAFGDDLTLFTSPSRGFDGFAIYRAALAEVGQPAP